MVTLRTNNHQDDGNRPVVTLENSLVSVTLLPDRGGQIVEILDKRSSTAICSGGLRGVAGQMRLDAPTSHQTSTPGSESDPGAISVFGLSEAIGIDVWSVVTLSPGSPWIQIDVRLHNRTLEAVRLPKLFGWSGQAQAWTGGPLSVVQCGDEGSGLLIRCSGPLAEDDAGWEALDTDPCVLMGGRSVEGTLSISAFGGLGKVSGVGDGWVAQLRSESLEIVSQEDFGEVELHVQVEDGQTMKASITLARESTTVVSLADLPPIARAAVVIAGRQTGEIHRNGPVQGPRRATWPSRAAEFWADGPTIGLDDRFRTCAREWQACLRDPRPLPTGVPGTEHIVATTRAMAAVRAEDWQGASQAIDDALVTNGDDPLLWWAKASIGRHSGEEDESSLPNAHFLSPMEPMLRVEAFLRQEQGQSQEPNPLVAPLTTDPAIAWDCLARLAAWGLWADFARLADELLRHRDDPAVRLLYAWSLARQTRMLATAAEHLAKADMDALLDVRHLPAVLRTAATELEAAFPLDPRLKAWLARLDASPE